MDLVTEEKHKLQPIPKRRKRSDMTRTDCLRALEQFASKVCRMKETSEGFDGSNTLCVLGQINVKFVVNGSFGTADRLFEAIRICGGWKLAADDWQLKE